MQLCNPQSQCCCVADARSWNVSKVLHLSFWHEMLKYIALVLLVPWIYSMVSWIKMYNCYIRPLMAVMQASADGSSGLDPADAEQMAHTCSVGTVLEEIVMVLVVICLLCWALFAGGKRRRQMREELGIPVSTEGRCCSCCHNSSEYCNDDCCLHFWCMPCALAQETRTILHEEAVGSMPPRLVGAGYRSNLAGEMLLVAPDEVDDMKRSATALPV